MNLSDKRLWIFDVDNTMIRDVEHPEPFSDALNLWIALAKRDVTLAVLTNVGRLSARQVHGVVQKAGFQVNVSNVFTAGAAAAAYIHGRSPRARCFVIGEGGAQEDFIARGLDVASNPPIDFVAVGADRGMTFQELNFAAKMVMKGAGLICISGSLDYPGVYLGNEDVFIGERSVTAAIEHATGVSAIVVGKPLPEIVIETVRALGFKPEDAVMVGDNPASDVAGGRAAGVSTVLVQRPDNIVQFDSGGRDTKPDVVVSSLDEILQSF